MYVPAGSRGPKPAGQDELPGECGGRGGVRAPGSARPGSAYRLQGDRPARARAGPGGKELSEWHFLPDLRVLGTVGPWSLRGGATGPGSEVLDPPPALARAPEARTAEDPEPACHGGGWKGPWPELRGGWPAGKFLDPGKLLAGGPLSSCRLSPPG